MHPLRVAGLNQRLVQRALTQTRQTDDGKGARHRDPWVKLDQFRLGGLGALPLGQGIAALRLRARSPRGLELCAEAFGELGQDNWVTCFELQLDFADRLAAVAGHNFALVDRHLERAAREPHRLGRALDARFENRSQFVG